MFDPFVLTSNFSGRAIDDGLTAHWSATLQGDPTDITGRGNNGVYSGGMTGTVSDIDGTGTAAWDFDGTSGHYISVPANTDLAPLFSTRQMAFSAWVKLNANDRVTRYAVDFEGANTYQWWLRQTTGVSAMSADFEQSGFGGAEISLAIPGISEAVWLHIVANCNPGTRNEAFLNGVSTASNANDQTDIRDVLQPMDIGGGLSPGQWSGRIDTIRVYNRVLTQEEITELFNAGRGEDGIGQPPTPTFQAAWAARSNVTIQSLARH